MNQRGLTLIEVVVAAALVLGVVVAASNGVGAIAGTAARVDRHDVAENRVNDELEACRALAFCDPSRPGDERADLVSNVFPHADLSRNDEQARYQAAAADGHPSGTFVTTVPDDDGVLTVAATFVAATVSGWTPVTPDGSYDAGRTAPLPAGALSVRVAYVCGRGRHHGAAERTTVIVCPAGHLSGLEIPPIDGAG